MKNNKDKRKKIKFQKSRLLRNNINMMKNNNKVRKPKQQEQKRRKRTRRKIDDKIPLKQKNL